MPVMICQIYTARLSKPTVDYTCRPAHANCPGSTHDRTTHAGVPTVVATSSCISRMHPYIHSEYAHRTAGELRSRWLAWDESKDRARPKSPSLSNPPVHEI